MIKDLRFMKIKKTIKKATSILLLFSMVFTSFPSNIFAQNLSSVPSPEPTKVFPNENLPANFNAIDEDQNQPVLDLLTDQNQPSASFRNSKIIARLAKSSFQAKEKVELKVLNGVQNDDFTVVVNNNRNTNVRTHIDKKFVNGEFLFSINPEVGMKPGKY